MRQREVRESALPYRNVMASVETVNAECRDMFRVPSSILIQRTCTGCCFVLCLLEFHKHSLRTLTKCDIFVIHRDDLVKRIASHLLPGILSRLTLRDAWHESRIETIISKDRQQIVNRMSPASKLDKTKQQL